MECLWTSIGALPIEFLIDKAFVYRLAAFSFVIYEFDM